MIEQSKNASNSYFSISPPNPYGEDSDYHKIVPNFSETLEKTKFRKNDTNINVFRHTKFNWTNNVW